MAYKVSKVDKDFDIMKFAEKQLMCKSTSDFEDGGIIINETIQSSYDNMIIYPKSITKAERDEVRADIFQSIKGYEEWKKYGATDLIAAVYSVNKSVARNMAQNLINSNYTTNEPQTKECTGFELDRDYRGDVQKTINNYVVILSSDPEIKGKIKFNEITEKAEFEGEIWTDRTDSILRNLIESKYAIDSKDKYYNAINIVWGMSRYNPIKNIIESTKWDGTPRIENMLCKWLKADNTPYSHEVSRLIFAGGIHRLYNPGCKFDEMVVLIGRQGEGKSTFVEWLNMNNDYFNDIDNIEGQKGMEAVQGRWICEIGELKALKKVGEDTAKSFLSRRSDNYRSPYSRYILDHPRRCIFIGTTNNQEFLTDHTGNRRYYPITVHSKASTLFESEAELRNDVLQCWCEAKYLYDLGELPTVFNNALLHYLEEAREEAEVYDYRKDLISDYLADKNECCVLEVAKEALKMNMEPSKKESIEIKNLILSIEGWKDLKSSKRFRSYGKQRVMINESMPF